MFSAACTKKFDDTKRVIGIRYSKKNRQYNDKRKKTTKGQIMIYNQYTEN